MSWDPAIVAAARAFASTVANGTESWDDLVLALEAAAARTACDTPDALYRPIAAAIAAYEKAAIASRRGARRMRAPSGGW